MSAPDIGREAKRACAAREAAMRRRVYPAWVRAGRMTQAEADREIATMEAIAADYAPADLFGPAARYSAPRRADITKGIE